MIKKIRKRMISASMLSLFLVITLIIGIAGLLNYHSVIVEADGILNLLSDPESMVPLNPEGHTVSGPEERPRQFEMTDGISSDLSSGTPETSRNSIPPFTSPELPFESRYFQVTATDNSTVISVNLEQIAAIDEETAASYALSVLSQDHVRGFHGQYRYLIWTEETQTQILFLDCQRLLGAFQRFMKNIVLIGILGLLATFTLLLIFSSRIFKPFLENYEKQKRFTTDAGHELKTPLTIINADADVLEMDFGSNEWLSDIRTQTSRLAELTNNLIELARMEEVSDRHSATEIDLSQLIRQTTESFSAPARSSGKTLSKSIEENVMFSCEPEKMRRLIALLLDNAIKYSSPDSTIDVLLQKKHKDILISVKNTTDHISREQVPHLFDRFYRTDHSRNSSTGGHGLGLSIAQAIVESCHGKITARTEDERALIIEITLPQ